MNSAKVFLLILCVMFLSLTACRMATGPLFQPAEIRPEKAVVYVYRPAASRWASPEKNWPYLFADGNKYASLAIGGYAVLYENPGKHVYEVKSMHLQGLLTGKTLETVEINIELGKEYYLAFVQSSRGFDMQTLIEFGLAVALGNSHADLLHITRLFSPVEKEFALPELQKTRYLGKL